MLKTTAMLIDELKECNNPMAKIKRLTAEGKLIHVIRGLYETDDHIPGYCLASAIYGPSYLSFAFALAYYSLIPEKAYNFTSATFEKKKIKVFNALWTFLYRDMPSEVYPLGLILHLEQGYGFQIATPEKALCDQLYITPPLSNRNELEQFLFRDLRFDEKSFSDLNMNSIIELTDSYHTKHHALLMGCVTRRFINGTNH